MNNFTIHEFKLNQSEFTIFSKKEFFCSEAEKAFMSNFYNSLTKMILEIQKKGLGINKIGNAIRYSSNFQELFKNGLDKFEVRKGFENRRYVEGLLLSMLEDLGLNSNMAFILILEKEFRKSSKLVDASAITFEDISNKIEDFYKIFMIKNPCQINVIEINSIPDYRFTSDLDGEYSFMSKIY
jgi:hypothetical protein